VGLKRFNLESLKDLKNGEALVTFQTAVQRAVKDCIDRPGDKRARKVILQMTLKPVPQITGNTIDCDGAKGTFQCRVRIPDWETQEVDFGVQQSGDLLYNPDSPNDHRQRTLVDGEDDKDDSDDDN
jgi:hypothetical protein